MPSRFAAKKAAAAAATAAPSNGATSPMSAIVCTAQQSRFHTATLEGSVTEVDIKDLGISVGDRDLLVNAHLRLKAGRIYALTGRSASRIGSVDFCFTDMIALSQQWHWQNNAAYRSGREVDSGFVAQFPMPSRWTTPRL